MYKSLLFNTINQQNLNKLRIPKQLKQIIMSCKGISSSSTSPRHSSPQDQKTKKKQNDVTVIVNNL